MEKKLNFQLLKNLKKAKIATLFFPKNTVINYRNDVLSKKSQMKDEIGV